MLYSMSMTNYLTKQQFSQAKRRLTLAKKTGDPATIIETVNDQFSEWDDGGYAYPDNWHDWERARLDAEMSLAVGERRRVCSNSLARSFGY